MNNSTLSTEKKGVNSNIDRVSIWQSLYLAEDRPRYKALADSIISGIMDGSITQGTKLPPHRQMADILGVTPGTVSKAYAEVEKLGLVTSRVGAGTYVQQKTENEFNDFQNALPEEPRIIDMSRNMHIRGTEASVLGMQMAQMSRDFNLLTQLMEYTPDRGLPHHRQAGAQWFRHSQFAVDPENVLVANGAQHGLLIALMALARPDDLVVSEMLSYPGLISVARHLGLKLQGLETDDEGLLPEALDDACQHNRVSLLYCTPTLQNPTTGIMSISRREAIAKVARKHNLLILEDDAHGLLVEDRPPALAAFAPERTVLITGLAKAVAAGLRVGYLAVPHTLRERIAAAVRSTCWMATPLTVEIGSKWILDGTADSLRINQLAEVHRRKKLVEPHLKKFSYRSHPDCCHYWISVPEPWRANELCTDLEQRGILVKSAEAFAVTRGSVPHFIRASVSCAPNDDALVHGIKGLSTVLEHGPTAKLDL